MSPAHNAKDKHIMNYLIFKRVLAFRYSFLCGLSSIIIQLIIIILVNNLLDDMIANQFNKYMVKIFPFVIFICGICGFFYGIYKQFIQSKYIKFKNNS